MKPKTDSELERRDFIKLAGVFGAGLMTTAAIGRAADRMNMPVAPSLAQTNGKADVTLHIRPVLFELDKEHTLSTIGYNGQVPGPVIRLKEDKVVTVDLFNDTDTPEFVHWHGQIIPSEVDGATRDNALLESQF
jgi:FtsP/CotA-like multicopper oxidase with cupredoxin domain